MCCVCTVAKGLGHRWRLRDVIRERNQRKVDDAVEDINQIAWSDHPPHQLLQYSATYRGGVRLRQAYGVRPDVRVEKAPNPTRAPTAMTTSRVEHYRPGGAAGRASTRRPSIQFTWGCAVRRVRLGSHEGCIACFDVSYLSCQRCNRSVGRVLSRTHRELDRRVARAGGLSDLSACSACSVQD